MLITELKAKETLASLIVGKVFIINCHGCKEIYFPEAEANEFQVFGSNYFNLILTLVIAGMGGPTRYIRAQVMSLRQKEFVEREVAMGASTPRIMFMHVLPQCSSYLLVTLGAGISSKIMSLASMSFLGVGLPSGVPNWGTLIAGGQTQLMVRPYLTFYPMIALAITNFGFAILGDGLRDLLDPKTK